jgi:hypothetical protein
LAPKRKGNPGGAPRKTGWYGSRAFASLSLFLGDHERKARVIKNADRFFELHFRTICGCLAISKMRARVLDQLERELFLVYCQGVLSASSRTGKHGSIPFGLGAATRAKDDSFGRGKGGDTSFF